MSKVLLIHGPNLNLLGTREPDKYGQLTSDEIVEGLNKLNLVNKVDYCQSNSESDIVNAIQNAGTYSGLIINAGAFSHTSVAIADALRALKIPKLAVHITNIYQRENYRHTDLVGEACDGAIVGLGTEGYRLALEHLSDTV
jgi:3-dehydroquinate dehydratase-2